MESFSLCPWVPSQLISEKVTAINTAAKNVLVYKSCNGCLLFSQQRLQSALGFGLKLLLSSSCEWAPSILKFNYCQCRQLQQLLKPWLVITSCSWLWVRSLRCFSCRTDWKYVFYGGECGHAGADGPNGHVWPGSTRCLFKLRKRRQQCAISHAGYGTCNDSLLRDSDKPPELLSFVMGGVIS